MIYPRLIKIKKRKAFTLIEILVSVSILIFIIIAISSIFTSVSRGTKETAKKSSALEDVNYFLNLASDSISRAEKGDGSKCGISENSFFELDNSHLSFIVDGQCYFFDLVYNNGVNRIEMGLDYKGSGFISSESVNISRLDFVVEDFINLGQPIVSILVEAHPLDDEDNLLSLQTSISVNHYD